MPFVYNIVARGENVIRLSLARRISETGAPLDIRPAIFGAVIGEP
jgi:hypothetical protein